MRCAIANGPVAIAPGDLTQRRYEESVASPARQYEPGYLCLRQAEGFAKDLQAFGDWGLCWPDFHRETVKWL